MIKSKFRLFSYITPAVALFFCALMCIIGSIYLKTEFSSYKPFIYLVVCAFALIIFIFGELRTKAIEIKIENKVVTKKGYFGFGSMRQFNLEEFEGYKTAILSSTAGTFEYLYLIKDGKKAVKMSEFYHKNYFELKQSLGSKVKFLGTVPFNLFNEVKEVFQ